MSDHIDADGFEIPDEFWPVATDEEIAQSMNVYEFNKWLNMPPERQERYRIAIIQRNLARLHNE